MNQLLTADLTKHEIDFSKITPENFIEALEVLKPQMIREHEVSVNEAPLTYKALFETSPSGDRLSLINAYLYNLTRVANTPEYHAIFERYIEELDELSTKMSLDERAYYKLCAYTNTQDFKEQDELKHQYIYDIISRMEDSGIHLDETEKEKLYKNTTDMGKKETQFNYNIMQAQKNSSVVVSDNDVDNLNERISSIVKSCEVIKEEEGIKFYKVPYSKGLYTDLLTHCHNEATRKAIYDERKSLNIEGEFSNLQLTQDIVSLSNDRAKILGHNNFSDFALRKRMAKKNETALNFIQEIGNKALPFAKKEVQILQEFAKEKLGREMKNHDVAYICNTYMEEFYKYSSESVREYFTLNQVLNGFFEIFETLYQIKFTPVEGETLWNDRVKVFNVVDNNNEKMGKIYFDLYTRESKQPGAWMMDVVSRDTEDGKIITPVVYVVANVSDDGRESPTMDIDDVNTFFHEMGHAFHSLLSKVNLGAFSGINNVQLDAIELPSQFMENFIYDYEVLKKITSHYQSGEVLPYELFQKILQSKNFNSAIFILRQCCLAKLDLLSYSETGKSKTPIEIEKDIISEWATSNLSKDGTLVTPNFSHIFGGGYKSGYYSYLWADVLAADAFNALKEQGNSYLEQIEAANLFKKHILEVGGVNDMTENFQAFRGRDPDIKHLFNRYGIPA